MGASIVAVAPASQHQAEKIEPRLGFPLYLDEAQHVREVLGLHRPSLIRWLTNLPGWLRYLRGLLRVRRQGRITGHFSNVPAVAIISKGGDVEFLHKGRTMGDYPKLRDVLGQLEVGNS